MEASSRLDGIDAPALTLWKINKSSEEALKLTTADLEGEKPLDPMTIVGECWTDLSAARMVHVFIADPLRVIDRKRKETFAPEETKDEKRKRVVDVG
ncbi:hypothetical protein FRB99_003155, partial [Tulasnella sp. 403]